MGAPGKINNFGKCCIFPITIYTSENFLAYLISRSCFQIRYKRLSKPSSFTGLSNLIFWDFFLKKIIIAFSQIAFDSKADRSLDGNNFVPTLLSDVLIISFFCLRKKIFSAFSFLSMRPIVKGMYSFECFKVLIIYYSLTCLCHW